MFYLDASVIVPLFATELSSAAVLQWFADHAEPLVTGQLAVGEAASAISRKRRTGELSKENGEAALVKLDTWLEQSVVVVEHESGDMAEASMLVRQPHPKLLMPDAIHIATSRRLGHSLVTADDKLAPVLRLYQIDWTNPAR